MAQAARRFLLRSLTQQSASTSTLRTASPLLFSQIRCFSEGSKLFVGGISFNTTEDGLRNAFAAHGEVVEAKIIMDRESGRSRGFGFVTFYNEENANEAMAKLNGYNLDGRSIRVDKAAARAPRPSFGGGDGGSFGGGYGGGSSGGAGGGFGGGRSSSGFSDFNNEPAADDADYGTLPDMSARF